MSESKLQYKINCITFSIDKNLTKNYTSYMNTEDKIAEVLSSLHQPLGVISTVNEECHPELASLYYVHDDALNIYFITREGSRKYKNITKNPHVAFVITTEHPARTIQLEGVAAKDTDPREENEYFAKLVALASEHLIMPPVSQIEDGEMLFMKMTTRWARLGDFEIMKEGDKFIETNLI